MLTYSFPDGTRIHMKEITFWHDVDITVENLAALDALIKELQAISTEIHEFYPEPSHEH